MQRKSHNNHEPGTILHHRTVLIVAANFDIHVDNNIYLAGTSISSLYLMSNHKSLIHTMFCFSKWWYSNTFMLLCSIESVSILCLQASLLFLRMFGISGTLIRLECVRSVIQTVVPVQWAINNCILHFFIESISKTLMHVARSLYGVSLQCCAMMLLAFKWIYNT